jgi:hypothetical protein
MMHQGNVGNYRLMMPQANPAGCLTVGCASSMDQANYDEAMIRSSASLHLRAKV